MALRPRNSGVNHYCKAILGVVSLTGILCACTAIGVGGAPNLSDLLPPSNSGGVADSEGATSENAVSTSQLLTSHDLYNLYEAVLQYYVDPVDPHILVKGAQQGFALGAAQDGLLPLEADLVDDAAPTTSDDPDEVWAPFGSAYQGFLHKIASRSDVGQIGQAAASGMLAALNDPHTSFIDARTVQSLQGASLSGIGVVLWSADGHGPPVIREVIAGGPAAQSGVHVGDTILAVDGRSTSGRTVSDIAVDIRGAAGSAVALSLESNGESTSHELSLSRAAVQRNLVDSSERDGLAYVRIISFQSGVADQVRDALAQAVQRGDRGWIIDLRGNPGGDLQEVTDTGASFIGTVPLAMETDRSGQSQALRSSESAILPRPPIVVLTDDSTASGAEVLAAALQEYRIAAIVGQHTAGVVGVATTVPLHDGSEAQITAQKLLTPNGVELNNTGLTPDVLVASNVDDWVAGRDPELDGAEALLNGQSTQPAVAPS